MYVEYVVEISVILAPIIIGFIALVKYDFDHKVFLEKEIRAKQIAKRFLE